MCAISSLTSTFAISSPDEFLFTFMYSKRYAYGDHLGSSTNPQSHVLFQTMNSFSSPSLFLDEFLLLSSNVIKLSSVVQGEPQSKSKMHYKSMTVL